MIHLFKAEQFLKTDMDTAWKFFSSAGNLAKITPPEMAFKIHTQLDGREIYEGMIIDYTVRPLFGIPMKWQTEITNVNRPFSFTDRQLKGPYKIWEHHHAFTEKDGGVMMNDEVKYELPLGIAGDLAHRLIVKKKISSIFEFREKILSNWFK